MSDLLWIAGCIVGGTRQSLGSLLSVPIMGGARTLRMQVSAGQKRGASLAIDQVRQAVHDLLGLKDDLIELSVTAKESEDAPSEPVDFLEARLQADIPVPITAGRRYGQAERLAALRQAFQIWQTNGLLQ